MPQISYAFLTVRGAQKIAAAIATETPIDLTHIAIGDGATVPSGGETALYHEVARKTISGQGVVGGAPNTSYADIYLAAADGPYVIREAGLFDGAGELIAIARVDPPINKPIPSSGQVVEGYLRLQLAVSNASAVVISVDPTLTIAMQRLSLLPWIPVVSTTTTAPPVNPAIGDAYLIPAGATGSWAGHAGKITEWTSAGWAMMIPRDGHGIGLPDGRQLIRVGGAYIEAQTLRSLANIPVDSHVSLPPGAPAEGAQHLIAADPTGAWAGKAGQIARWIGGAWRYEIPRAGRVVTYMSGARLVTLRHDGTGWADWAVTLDTTAAPGPAPSSLHPQVSSLRWRGAVALPAGTDLDTVRTGGQYLATTPTHAPGAGDWIVEAIPSDPGGLRGHQIARKMGGQEAYHRYWIDGPSFSGWRKFLDLSDLTVPRFDVALPGFFFARSTGGTTVAPQTWTKIAVEEEVSDQQGWYNPVTSRFQPTKAGLYLFTGSVSFGSGADLPTSGARIYLNGVVQNNGFPTTVSGSQFGAAANGSNAIVVGYSYLNGTSDYAELYGFKGVNNAGDYVAGTSRFSGHFLGVP